MPADRQPIDAGLTAITGAAALKATAEVRLSEVAAQISVTVPERIALQDADLRQWMAEAIMPVFRWGNGMTLVVLIGLAGLDQFNLMRSTIIPGERIIDHQVVIAMLGATAVQVGAIAVIITRYLKDARLP